MSSSLLSQIFAIRFETYLNVFEILVLVLSYPDRQPYIHSDDDSSVHSIFCMLRAASLHTEGMGVLKPLCLQKIIGCIYCVYTAGLANENLALEKTETYSKKR